MQIQYERDNVQRRVTVTTGAGRSERDLALLERHRVEDDWSYARLYDVRNVTGRPSVEDLRLFMKLNKEHRPHGPEAILTSSPILDGLACTLHSARTVGAEDRGVSRHR